MESSVNQHQQNLSAIIHLSTFSKYFIPFGNFILPLVLWSSNKKDSAFVDANGKNAINFQISLLLYSIALGIISVPLFFHFSMDIFNVFDLAEHNTHEFKIDNWRDVRGNFLLILVILLFSLGLFLLDIFSTVMATIKANKGEVYNYRFAINFIK
ncbi:DUF4870 domain-containing protein [Spongiivirga citrea]|uniref:DUF4870 domain-containing protein n=1 Tax=Spongiivirga citrea TaxID=1481457 RepID=A0A6M0CD58_9FLAO|nr:DUF4870 domain-containing protein [Spongiivirga citrea]NER15715.1 DUF4870 domain-containing protein [Spongiivirga citrea]